MTLFGYHGDALGATVHAERRVVKGVIGEIFCLPLHQRLGD